MKRKSIPGAKSGVSLFEIMAGKSMEKILEFQGLQKEFKEKKAVFVTTKNLDYIRITQEKKLLEKWCGESSVVSSNNKNYYLRILITIIKLIFKKLDTSDIIFLGFLPQFIIPFTFWKLKKNVVYIDFFISLYDTMVYDRKKIGKASVLAKFLWNLDSFTLKRANYIICDTKSHGCYFADEFGVSYDKIRVLYLEADNSIYYPIAVKKPVEFLNKFIVLYFGSVLPLQGVDIVMEAIKRLNIDDYIHFIFIGPVGKEYAKAEGSNVTYINWLSQEELAHYIGFSDLCLAGHFSAVVKKADRTIPGKAYIYLSMDKRIILGDSEANHELFKEEKDKLWFVERGNPEALANLIKEISKNKN